MGQSIPSTIHDFVQVIDRHLLEARQVWRETGCRTTPTPGTLGQEAFSESQTDYLDAVSDLHSKVSSTLTRTPAWEQVVDRI